MTNNKKDKLKKKLKNPLDFDLLYDVLISGGSLGEYHDMMQDRTMPQEREYNKPITEDDVLAAWILGKDDEMNQYKCGGHLKQDYQNSYLNVSDKRFGNFGNPLNYNINDGSSINDGSESSISDAASLMGGMNGMNWMSSLAPVLGRTTGSIINKYDNIDDDYQLALGDAGADPIQRLIGNIGGTALDDAKAKLDYERMTNDAYANFGIGDTASNWLQYLTFTNSVGPKKQEIASKDWGSRIADNFNAFGQGALYGGSVGGGWGALIGGIAGGLANIGSQFLEEGNREKLNNEILKYNIGIDQGYKKFDTNLTNSYKMQLWNQLQQPYLNACGGKMKNRLASGGYINSHYDYITDPLVKVNAGGTHQENPNEGVQTSIAPDGQPNLVEEGETIINNGLEDAYVFSDRIVADDEILKSHLLPNKFAGKTYADISKELDKIIEEHKTDEVSQRTFDEMIKRLLEALEDQKYQEKAEEVTKFLDGLTDEQKELLEQTMVEEAQAEQQAAEEQAIAEQQAQEQAVQEQQMQPEQAPEQAPMEQSLEQIVPSRYNQIMSRALFADAADLGMFAKGGHLALNGKKYYGKNFLWEDNDELEEEQINSFYNPGRESYSNIIQSQPIEGLTPITIDATAKHIVPEKRDIASIGDFSLPAPSNDDIAEAGWRLDSSGNWTNKPKSIIDWSTYLRFAPAVGSGVLYLSDLFGVTNRNDYTNPNLLQRSINAIPNVGFTPLGGYRTFNPFDETYQLNVLRSANEAARRAVINNSNGNYGATLAALNALNYNTSGQFGDLALKAREYNEKERQVIDEYNLKINQINSSLSMSAQEKNQAIAALKARLTAALAEMRQQIEDTNDAARSANMTNFYLNLGNVGKENFNMTMARSNPAFYYTITDDGHILYKNGFDGLNERDQAFVRSVAEPQAEEQRKKHLEEANKKADDTTNKQNDFGLLIGGRNPFSRYNLFGNYSLFGNFGNS